MPTEDAPPPGRIAVLGSACPARARLTASGAEPMANCGAVRARHHHGGTQLGAWPARLRGCRPSGLPPGHVAACSRRGRDCLVNRPDLAGQHARVGRPDADLICGQGTVAEDAAGPRPCPAGPTAGRVRWNRDAAPAWPCPPAWWVGRSLATRPRAVTPRERPEDPPTGGDRHRARLGDRQGPPLHVLAQARRRPSVHPPDLRLALPGLPDPGRPFYSHGDLQYLEHGTGPLAAELDRLWQAKGTMKGGPAREGRGGGGDGWQALPGGAAGLAPDRPHVRLVRDLYYPGLQAPPPDHDGRRTGSGR